MLHLQQRLVTSPQDPGVVTFHVNAGYFSTTARRVTSPTWGPPPPCKQALNRPLNIADRFFCTSVLRELIFAIVKDLFFKLVIIFAIIRKSSFN